MEMDEHNLDSSLFNIKQPPGKPMVGGLLVAEPFLREEYFNHAIISLIEYEYGKSAMGFVLNKPTPYTLGETISGIQDEVDIPIYCGGPLSCERLFFLHSLGDEFKGARKVAEDLYVGGDFEQVKQYINMGLDTEGKIRFFVGYSGWDPYQLEDELDNNVWAVAQQPPIAELFNDNGDSLWHRVVRTLGDSYRNWLYHPIDPQYN